MFGDEMDFEERMIDHQFLTGGEDVNWSEFSDHEYQATDADAEDAYIPEENDVPLDGDAESALASCGWGTDEDYGDYGGDDPYSDW